MNEQTQELMVAAIIAIAALGAGYKIGRECSKKEAAEAGLGQYAINPKTGSTRFTWNQPSAATATNEPTETATTIALRFSVQNAEALVNMGKLNQQVVDTIAELGRRVTELERKESGSFVLPYYEFNGPFQTNHWGNVYTNPVWQVMTNSIDLDGIALTNVLVYPLSRGQNQ